MTPTDNTAALYTLLGQLEDTRRDDHTDAREWGARADELIPRAIESMLGLEDLAELLNAIGVIATHVDNRHLLFAAESLVRAVDVSDLPTWGDDGPADTAEIYSWDHGRVLRCEPGAAEPTWYLEPRQIIDAESLTTELELGGDDQEDLAERLAHEVELMADLLGVGTCPSADQVVAAWARLETRWRAISAGDMVTVAELMVTEIAPDGVTDGQLELLYLQCQAAAHVDDTQNAVEVLAALRVLEEVARVWQSGPPLCPDEVATLIATGVDRLAVKRWSRLRGFDRDRGHDLFLAGGIPLLLWYEEEGVDPPEWGWCWREVERQDQRGRTLYPEQIGTLDSLAELREMLVAGSKGRVSASDIPLKGAP